VTHFFEDFAVGQTFGSGHISVSEQEIKEFAARYDPQPFHLSDEAARKTILGGLAASGWHTAAMTMRLLVDGEMKPAGGIIGGGGEEILWKQPVRPGDELHLQSEILAVRLSKSRPGFGIVKVRTTTYNQANQPVQIFTANLMVPARG
jgi:acyl dehydratase